MKFPAAALAEAPKITEAFAPAATVKGLAGFEVTPLGSALSVTWTAPENPLTGFTVMLMAGLVMPWVMEIELDDKLNVKSGAGGGGGGLEEEVVPQPAEIKASKTRISSGTPWRNRPMMTPAYVPRGGLVPREETRGTGRRAPSRK
jgi:hypothetical protein